MASGKRGQIRIEPFKHPVAMDPGYAGGFACHFKKQGTFCAHSTAHHFIPQVVRQQHRRLHSAEKTWKVLEDAIHEIHNQNASGLSFEELYRY
jgi:cullin 3